MAGQAIPVTLVDVGDALVAGCPVALQGVAGDDGEGSAGDRPGGVVGVAEVAAAADLERTCGNGHRHVVLLAAVLEAVRPTEVGVVVEDAAADGAGMDLGAVGHAPTVPGFNSAARGSAQ